MTTTRLQMALDALAAELGEGWTPTTYDDFAAAFLSDSHQIADHIKEKGFTR